MNTTLNSSFFQKVILILGFMSISGALLFITSSTGYETSVYRNTELSMLLLLVPIMISISNVLFLRNNNFNILNIALFLIAGLVILLLPSIRYTFYPMGDESTHVGIIYDIILSNRSNDNIYPITHILISVIYFVSNVDYTKIVTYSAPFYSIISILYLYVLSRQVFGDTLKAMTSLYIGFFVLSSSVLNPHIFAVLTIPIVLFVYLKSTTNNSIGNKILLIIFAILYPFFHPLVAMILMVSVLLMGMFYRLLLKRRTYDKMFFITPLISLVVFILWLWYNFGFWDDQVVQMFRWLISDVVPINGRYNEVTLLFKDYNINILNLVIKIYTQNVIYVLISLYVVCRMTKKILSRNEYNEIDKKLVLLSGWIFVNIFLLFTVVFIPTQAGSDRMLNYTGVISSIFVTYFFFDSQKIEARVLSVLIVLLTINGVFIIHNSDYSQTPNLQVTQMEITGSGWLINHKDVDTKIKSNHERFYRIANMIKGVNYSNKYNLNDVTKADGGTRILNHFGYDKYNMISSVYKEYEYVLLEKYDETLYFKLYPNNSKFNRKDFEKLSIDTSISKIYNNNEFGVYKITKQ